MAFDCYNATFYVPTQAIRDLVRDHGGPGDSSIMGSLSEGGVSYWVGYVCDADGSISQITAVAYGGAANSRYRRSKTSAVAEGSENLHEG